MNLNFDKEIKDIRGKIIFLKNDNISVNLAEIKKGYARGGHYHPYDQEHFIISGVVEYWEKNTKSDKESRKIINKPTIIFVRCR